jgi:retron-type reverse transcriptase
VAASFDSVNHEWLLRMLSHRIADPRILRLIGQWLRAGVMERGEWKDALDGAPQGAGISPLLANVFLHYVLDLWVHRWRRIVLMFLKSEALHPGDFTIREDGVVRLNPELGRRVASRSEYAQHLRLWR